MASVRVYESAENMEVATSFNGPCVSIVIPVYNAAAHLRQCLDSVCGQSLRDIEVVCVDDGSTDGSASILAEYAARDRRVKVMRCNAGRGAGAARNAGLAAATGKWIHFVDADDVVFADAAQAASELAERSGADVVVFGAEEYDDATGMTTPLPLDLSVRPDDDAFLRAYSTMAWNKLYRRAFICGSGMAFQEIRRSEDVAFVVEVLCRASSIAVLDRVLYRYRIHSGGGLEATKHETPNAWREALDEARRRLVRNGIFERNSKAFGILEADTRLANHHFLPARVVASIRRRGLASFLKHAAGALALKFRRRRTSRNVCTD